MGILKLIMNDLSKFSLILDGQITGGGLCLIVLKVGECSVIDKTTGEILVI